MKTIIILVAFAIAIFGDVAGDVLFQLEVGSLLVVVYVLFTLINALFLPDR